MNVFRCKQTGCNCFMKVDDQRFLFPGLGADSKVCEDCGHELENHKVEHGSFLEEWQFRIFPLLLRKEQQALRVTCQEYRQGLKLGSKHRDYYRACSICGKRIRRRHKGNEALLNSMGIQSGDQYVHVRCLKVDSQ